MYVEVFKKNGSIACMYTKGESMSKVLERWLIRFCCVLMNWVVWYKINLLFHLNICSAQPQK